MLSSRELKELKKLSPTSWLGVRVKCFVDSFHSKTFGFFTLRSSLFT